ncbi:hypothetical protein [Streptomyces lavendulae]|uniref:hypothetical protein n=1 Tax=Streptomyces lavendulae TaxID=1914 RepID=UPI0031E65E50
MTATHFTAWLATDRSVLMTDNIDIAVIEDELSGGNPDNDSDWTSSGSMLFHAETTVDAGEGDVADAISEAVALMSAAGWEVDGMWEATDNAYYVTVTRA